MRLAARCLSSLRPSAAAPRPFLSRGLSGMATVQVFQGPNQPFQLSQVPLPAKLNDGEVLVKISLATVCGSDLHTVSGTRSQGTPAVLGHEAVGVVVESARSGVREGDRVTWTLADSCGRCMVCDSHHLPQKCPTLFKYGHSGLLTDASGLHGCYASHILLRPGTSIVNVPSSLSDRVVAPVNCALSTVMSVLSQVPRENCNSVVVQGAGLLGVYTVSVLKSMGVTNIICTDINAARLAQVAKFGAVTLNTGNLSNEQVKEAVTKKCGGLVDAVVEVAGVPDVVPQGISLLRHGGRYVLAGMVHPKSQLNITGEQLIRKCISLIGVHNYAAWDLKHAVEFLATHGSEYPFEDIVSPPLPLSSLNHAFALAKSQQWARVSVDPSL
eukprot:GILI01021121.1.p1 GENE.GILI01021121.1~~GILI01021121.1.p1  ORF type:complete len:384 (-),score=108.13 GILI01021121.1:357-1508(-)